MMWTRLLPVILLGGCTVAAAQTAPQAAGPPARTSPGVATPAERVPTDVRRVTMIVRSIENSMRLYRDVLGLKVNYDSEVTMSGVALPAGEPGAKARLVLLNGNAVTQVEAYAFTALAGGNLRPSSSAQAPLTMRNGGSTRLSYRLSDTTTTGSSALPASTHSLIRSMWGFNAMRFLESAMLPLAPSCLAVGYERCFER